MFSAHQVRELAFDLGARGSMVFLPRRRSLPCPTALESRFLGVDADCSTGLRVGAFCAKHAGGACRREVGDATAVGGVLANLDQHASGRCRLRIEIDFECILPEVASRCRRRLHLDVCFSASGLDLVDDLSRAVRSVAVDLDTRRSGFLAVSTLLVAVSSTSLEIGTSAAGDSLLGVGFSTSASKMLATLPSEALPGLTSVAVMISESGSIATCPLYPSKPRAADLVPVAGVRIDGRDHAIWCHATRDAKHPVFALLQVLSDDGRHELSCLRDLRIERAAIEPLRIAYASRASASTSASRASASSQSHAGLPAAP